jgi:hypothetical protein
MINDVTLRKVPGSRKEDEKVMRGEKGQTLVHVAMFMVLFMIVLAIAIDVGRIYSERRRMQNAADAGALAGAYEICFGPSAQFGGDWYEAARSYAVDRNGAEAAAIARTDWEVTVDATEVMDTYFAAFVGINTVDVGAEAAAACGEATSACGLWPIGFELARWYPLGCGETFYVWAGENETKDPDCSVYNCDVDGDGKEEVIPMDGRAWLDFSEVISAEFPDDCDQPGCGAQELKCWFLNDNGGKVWLPTCIPGDTGVKAGVKDAINTRTGDAVLVPLYDSLCGGVTCPGRAIHAVAFGCIRVMGWIQELTLNRLDGAQPPWKDKAIKARVECNPLACKTNCGGTSGNPPPPWGVWAVSLTR